MLRTTVRDCLYLNWAFPAEALPPPPSPLRYQRHVWQGRDYVFASALLFHQDSLHLTALPSLKFGYPQLNLRLYVLDDEGVPSVLFRRMLMPAWVAPGVRLITHQPAARARLRFPRPSQQRRRSVGLERRAHKGRLEVRAWPGSPLVGEGPRLGSWEESVRVFPGAPPRLRPGFRPAAADLGRSPGGRDLADAGGGPGGRPAAAPARSGAGDPLARRCTRSGSARRSRSSSSSGWCCGFRAAPATMPQPAAGRVVSFFDRPAAKRTSTERRRASC